MRFATTWCWSEFMLSFDLRESYDGAEVQKAGCSSGTVGIAAGCSLFVTDVAAGSAPKRLSGPLSEGRTGSMLFLRHSVHRQSEGNATVVPRDDQSAESPRVEAPQAAGHVSPGRMDADKSVCTYLSRARR